MRVKEGNSDVAASCSRSMPEILHDLDLLQAKIEQLLPPEPAPSGPIDCKKEVDSWLKQVKKQKEVYHD